MVMKRDIFHYNFAKGDGKRLGLFGVAYFGQAIEDRKKTIGSNTSSTRETPATVSQTPIPRRSALSLVATCGGMFVEGEIVDMG